LVADHSKSLTEATDLAQKLGVPVPSTMSQKQQEELAKQATYRGLHFDDEYAELEMSDHKADIEDATREVKQGCNPEVRDNARSEIPILEAHLALSEHVHGVIEAMPNHESDEATDDSTVTDSQPNQVSDRSQPNQANGGTQQADEVNDQANGGSQQADEVNDQANRTQQENPAHDRSQEALKLGVSVSDSTVSQH